MTKVYEFPLRNGLRCPVPGSRIVAALLRCVDCKHEWHGQVDESGAVVPEAARCPRCSQHQGPKTAA